MRTSIIDTMRHRPETSAPDSAFRIGQQSVGPNIGAHSKVREIEDLPMR